MDTGKNDKTVLDSESVEIKKMKVERIEEHRGGKEPKAGLFAANRILAFLGFFFLFIPGMNPARICTKISDKLSLFTSAVSYPSIVADMKQLFRYGNLDKGSFILLYIGAIVLALGILAVAVGACMSLGNLLMKKVSFFVSIPGAFASLAGVFIIYLSYIQISSNSNVGPVLPNGIPVYAVFGGLTLILNLILLFTVPKPGMADTFYMETKYQLFIMFLPFGLLAFIFCYLPLWGWRYSFFDYRSGGTLSSENFVGFYWFKYLFQNSATRRDIVAVLRNTLAMSGLGILTSWVPLAFAVFLAEIHSKVFKRFVQTFTTIPNFISWVLVYTVALAIFSTEGFINTFAQSRGWIDAGTATNYLMGDEHTWLKMLFWGLWKGTGWSAIIYIAGISSIDRQLYEAATVDGAGRFQRMWHVTLPGLLPTYMVMLLMAVAGALSNGLDQYLVFSNASNLEHMQVLDLYVYQLGVEKGSIPLSTVIGMSKSIVSIVLFFMANTISKLVRGESIV